MFFDFYPYTNMHNVNLDWVLQKVKAWGEMVEQNNQNFIDLQAANESFKEYVTGYITNLDVQDEINHKLDQMLASGALTPYMEPYIITSVEDWLNDHITPTTPAIDNTLSIAGAAADAKAAGDAITEVSDTFKAYKEELTIENYSHPFVLMPGTVVTGAYMSINGTPAPVAGYKYMTVEVEGGESYLITGFGGTGNRLYIVEDANNHVIATYPLEPSPHQFVDVEYRAPDNAKYIIVNGQGDNVTAVKLIDLMQFVSASNVNQIGEKTGTTTYTVNAGEFKTLVNLSGSANGAFNFDRVNLNNALFKGCNDDITPFKLLTAGYVGGNHGYNWIYNCTITGHGLAETDIGKTYNDGTNTFVLIQITDSDTVVVGCYDSTVWWKLKQVAPTVLNFGSGNLNVTNAVRGQLYPSVKDVLVEVIENNAEHFTVRENYTIIDVGTGIEYIIGHVGSNTNNSIALNAGGLVKITNIYQFESTGAVLLYQGANVLKNVAVESYGGVQCMPFLTNGFYAVPDTALATLTRMAGADVTIPRSIWDDDGKPPIAYVTSDIAASTKMFIIGYLMTFDRNGDLDSSAGTISSVNKLYPYVLQPNGPITGGNSYNWVSFRAPLNMSGRSYNWTYIKDNDRYYIIAAFKSAMTVSLAINGIYNKQVEVLTGHNVQCSDLYTDSLTVTASGEAYLIVEIS